MNVECGQSGRVENYDVNSNVTHIWVTEITEIIVYTLYYLFLTYLKKHV